ncbi:MAG TPA: hypothetical protein VGE59_04730, partial [Patescibacteria group bacterium]
HTSFLMNGLKVVGETVTKSRPAKQVASFETGSLEPEETSVVTEESTKIKSPVEITSPVHNSTEEGDFRVHTYWQGKTSVSPHVEEIEEAETELYQTRPPLVTSQVNIWKRTQPRTLYLLLGCLAVLGLTIKVVNTVLKHTPDTSQAIAERDSLITQAQESARKAETALVSDDKTTAIAEFLASQDFLAQISDKNQTETSRSLAARTSEKIDTLTKTTQLSQTQSAQSLPTASKQVTTTANGTYILTHENTLYKYTATELTPLTTLPTGFALTEAVPYENLQKLALYGKTSDTVPALLSIVTVTDQLTPLTRSDSAPWPDAKHIASFESNLYLVGDTMSKAIPKDSAYRVIPYANNDSTKTITNILNNGFAFYALEEGKQLVRIAANTAKTPVKLYGVPDAFLPTAINRLISTRKEGSLYLLDTNGQRILEISTDGAYRQQYKLPKNDTYTDCDATDKEFICTTTKKEIKTIPFSS